MGDRAVVGTLTRMDPHGDRLQVLAANVDLVLVTCPADRPSIERVERETVLVVGQGAQPAVLVTKADLDAAAALSRRALRDRLVGVEVLADLGPRPHRRRRRRRGRARPYRRGLGLSARGKSTLINVLLGEDRLATAAVRRRGRPRSAYDHDSGPGGDPDGRGGDRHPRAAEPRARSP